MHKNILIKILKDIYKDNSLGPILGFKGGTAALLFYEMPRFSVDLDFDLLDQEKEDYVFDRIKKIISVYGEAKKAEIKRFNLFFLLSYKKESHNIKVEINRRNFGSSYDVKSYLGISMKVMIEEDMFANKIVAMYERINKANRDIFDTWHFLQNDWPINKELVKQRTGLVFKEFLVKMIKRLEEMGDVSILSGMGEFLDAKQKAWAKKNLVNDVLFLLQLKLENEK